jgi:hypothetical protein
MKLSAMIAVFAFCSSSFAATFANGIQLNNLPSATKSYSKMLGGFEDRATAPNLMKEECLKDKAAAEAFIVKSGSKILTSTGCEVREIAGYADQGGYQPDEIVTNFEVVFK